MQTQKNGLNFGIFIEVIIEMKHILTLKNLVLLFILLISSISMSIKAQDIGAFEDDQKWFYVFDRGEFHRLEFNPVKNFYVGGSFVAYVDFQNRFKVFYNGKLFELQDAVPTQIGNSDFLFGYMYFRNLKILWNNKIETYDTWSYRTQFGDSMIAYIDYMNAMKVFQNGALTTVETWADTTFDFKVADNMLVYFDQNRAMCVYTNGVKNTIESIPPKEFKNNLFKWLIRKIRLKFFNN